MDKGGFGLRIPGERVEEVEALLPPSQMPGPQVPRHRMSHFPVPRLQVPRLQLPRRHMSQIDPERHPREETRSVESLEERFQEGLEFHAYLDMVQDTSHPWADLFRRAKVPQDLLDRALALDGSWSFLVLNEGWCGDSANSLPYLARLVESVPQLEMRILSRDENQDLMDSHLTGSSRSIPVVLILDNRFSEVGWWGPRPAALQQLFLRDIKPLPPADRYPKLRAWYARDRGRAILTEILDAIPGHH